MSAYVIAGKADDPSFARAEFAAKQIEVACPGVFFHYEMKHPDAWKAFITSVFRKYDFDGFSDDFTGPLVWTHEGDLVGGSVEFVQKICVEKFGMGNPPVATDPMFKAIANDNLKQVQRELYRKANGSPFSERVDVAAARAKSSGLLGQPKFDNQRQLVVAGARFEVWTLSTDRNLTCKALREEFSDGKPATVNAGLAVTLVGGGKEQTHLVLLHPYPLARKHLVLPKRRHCREIRIQKEEKQTTEEAGPDTTMVGDLPQEVVAASDQERFAEIGIFDFGLGSEEDRTIQVPPSTFRSTPMEDFAEEDFSAAMEALINIGGVATWMGLKGGTEYRHPLDTHLQILPFPLHTVGEDCPLRYPLELTIERAVREGEKTISAFNFSHSLVPIKEASGQNRGADLAKNALAAFESVRGRSRDSCLLAFTEKWLLYVPLRAPPEAGSLHHDAWMQFPPPHPCALAGILVVDAMTKFYPEAVGLNATSDLAFVSNRALHEGIPQGSPEYEAAQKEARINTKILDSPSEIIGVWAMPR